MNRPALPLAWGQQARVDLCLMASAPQALAKSMGGKAPLLSFKNLCTITPRLRNLATLLRSKRVALERVGVRCGNAAAAMVIVRREQVPRPAPDRAGATNGLRPKAVIQPHRSRCRIADGNRRPSHIASGNGIHAGRFNGRSFRRSDRARRLIAASSGAVFPRPGLPRPVTVLRNFPRYPRRALLVACDQS